MVFCARAVLSFTTAARRDAVQADLDAYVAARSRWGTSVLRAVTGETGVPGVVMETRFVVRADADGLLAQLEAFATGVRTPLAGSWVRLHACPHDEGGNVCVVDTSRGW